MTATFQTVMDLVVLQDTGRGKKRKHLSGEAGGESPMYGEGDWRDDSGKVVAEAGMILRDPSALHLIIKQVTDGCQAIGILNWRFVVFHLSAYQMHDS